DFTVIKIQGYFTKETLMKYDSIKTDILLWSDRPQPDLENYFPSSFDMPVDGLSKNVLLVCATKPPEKIRLAGVKNYYANLEYNVVGMLPGKSKPNEIVVFSAHYDHEGVYRRGRKRDSILNGAND